MAFHSRHVERWTFEQVDCLYSQLICRNLRDFVRAVQLFTLDASSDQDEEEAGQ